MATPSPVTSVHSASLGNPPLFLALRLHHGIIKMVTPVSIHIRPWERLPKWGIGAYAVQLFRQSPPSAYLLILYLSLLHLTNRCLKETRSQTKTLHCAHILEQDHNKGRSRKDEESSSHPPSTYSSSSMRCSSSTTFSAMCSSGTSTTSASATASSAISTAGVDLLVLTIGASAAPLN